MEDIDEGDLLLYGLGPNSPKYNESINQAKEARLGGMEAPVVGAPEAFGPTAPTALHQTYLRRTD